MGSFFGQLGHGLAARSDATRLLLVAGFWLFTYAVMTTRAALLPDLPFSIVYPKRIVSTGLGALCLWQLARALDARRAQPVWQRLTFAAGAVLASALLLVAVRLLWGIVAPSPDSSFDQEGRWILTWTGYFAGAICLHQILDLAAHAGADSPADATGSPPYPYPTEIRVSRNQAIVLVPLAGVRWFESDGNYVQVHGADGPEGWLRSSMRALTDLLDPAMFIRLHRSVICARRLVRGVRRKPSGALVALLEDGTELPIGRAHAPAVLDALGLSETSVPEERRSSPEHQSS